MKLLHHLFQWPPRATLSLNHTAGKNYRGVMLLGCIYIGSLVLGGLCAPVIMQLVDYCHVLSPSGLTTYLLKKPLSIYIDRIRLIGAILGLLYVARRYDFLSLWPKSAWQKSTRPFILRGALAGILLILILGGIQSAMGIVALEEDWVLFKTLMQSAKILATALLIAGIEETLFRGFIFRAFYSAFSPQTAAIISSFLFAWLHFKGPKILTDLSAIDVVTSLKTAGLLFLGPVYEFQALPFLNLWLLGYLLTRLYVQSGHLWIAWAFHAGLIWASFTYKTIVDTQVPSWLWGTAKCIDGVLSLILLTAVLLGISCRWVYGSENSNNIGRWSDK